jgi:hypothetical protein
VTIASTGGARSRRRVVIVVVAAATGVVPFVVGLSHLLIPLFLLLLLASLLVIVLVLLGLLESLAVLVLALIVAGRAVLIIPGLIVVQNPPDSGLQGLRHVILNRFPQQAIHVGSPN